MMKNICGNNIWLWFCRSFRACFSSGVAIPGDTGDLQPPIRRALFQRLFQSLCPLQGQERKKSFPEIMVYILLHLHRLNFQQPPIRRALFQRLFQSLCPLQCQERKKSFPEIMVYILLHFHRLNFQPLIPPPVSLFQRLFQSFCPLQGNTVFNPERAFLLLCPVKYTI